MWGHRPHYSRPRRLQGRSPGHVLIRAAREKVDARAGLMAGTRRKGWTKDHPLLHYALASTLRMNIDLLPFSAFALESSAGASRQSGESHTLTMRLGLSPVHPGLDPAMEGTVGFTDLPQESAPVLRACVGPVAGPVLTITF